MVTLLFVCARIIGVFLMVYSMTLIPPTVFSLIIKDHASDAFLLSMEVTAVSGFFLWLLSRQQKKPLRTRDGFIVVVLFYCALSLFGALPFYLIETPNISLTDAIFESVSGVTTTGSTILTNIDALPKSIIYYRQQLQFLGGMGIIVLAIAIMPMLGIGGMALFRAETTGPVKDNKLTPRITETAKALWTIYVALTAACCLAYWFAGMTLFDAICYSFATVATGGYAPHDASLGFYPSERMQLVCIVFMLLGSLNFSLHFHLFKRWALWLYIRDTELVFYSALLLVATVLVVGALWIHGTHTSVLQMIVSASFHVVSIMTTTGFAADDYTNWPSFVPYLILLMGLIGGCSGSTSGGIKAVRLLILIKQASRELKRLVHPNGQFLLKINQKTIPNTVTDSVFGFIAIYLIVFLIIMLLLIANQVDFTTAFSSVIASLANVGPGLANASVHFADMNVMSKWVLITAMLLGRLEIFTLIILLSPIFWRS